jgi:DNA-directed RNA polymerase III subunit RPC11
LKSFKSFKKTKIFTPKKVDDMLSKEDYKNVDQTSVTCPKCEHGKAYFMMIQIRSADEPSTIFYKCCSCEYDWRGD